MKTYLGDGVYAEMIEDAIKLTTENGLEVIYTIYLNGDVYNNLLRFVAGVIAKNKRDEPL